MIVQADRGHRPPVPLKTWIAELKTMSAVGLAAAAVASTVTRHIRLRGAVKSGGVGKTNCNLSY